MSLCDQLGISQTQFENAQELHGQVIASENTSTDQWYDKCKCYARTWSIKGNSQCKQPKKAGCGDFCTRHYKKFIECPAPCRRKGWNKDSHIECPIKYPEYNKKFPALGLWLGRVDQEIPFVNEYNQVIHIYGSATNALNRKTISKVSSGEWKFLPWAVSYDIFRNNPFMKDSLYDSKSEYHSLPASTPQLLVSAVVGVTITPPPPTDVPSDTALAIVDDHTKMESELFGSDSDGDDGLVDTSAVTKDTLVFDKYTEHWLSSWIISAESNEGVITICNNDQQQLRDNLRQCFMASPEKLIEFTNSMEPENALEEIGVSFFKTFIEAVIEFKQTLSKSQLTQFDDERNDDCDDCDLIIDDDSDDSDDDSD